MRSSEERAILLEECRQYIVATERDARRGPPRRVPAD